MFAVVLFLWYNNTHKTQIRLRRTRMQLNVGDVVEMKKQHPCGEKRFTVLRVGADIKIKCNGCGRELMQPRFKTEKAIKKVVQPKTAPGNEKQTKTSKY